MFGLFKKKNPVVQPVADITPDPTDPNPVSNQPLETPVLAEPLAAPEVQPISYAVPRSPSFEPTIQAVVLTVYGEARASVPSATTTESTVDAASNEPASYGVQAETTYVDVTPLKVEAVALESGNTVQGL